MMLYQLSYTEHYLITQFRSSRLIFIPCVLGYTYCCPHVSIAIDQPDLDLPEVGTQGSPSHSLSHYRVTQGLSPHNPNYSLGPTLSFLATVILVLLDPTKWSQRGWKSGYRFLSLLSLIRQLMQSLNGKLGALHFVTPKHFLPRN